MQDNSRGDKPHASPWLLNHLKSADLLWEGARVRFGCILSGEKLVDNLDFREQLRGFESEMAINHVAGTTGKHRHFETELADGRSHPIDRMTIQQKLIVVPA